jgi:hypothetical protein
MKNNALEAANQLRRIADRIEAGEVVSPTIRRVMNVEQSSGHVVGSFLTVKIPEECVTAKNTPTPA